MEPIRPLLYRPYTVSRMLGISVRTVYRLIQSGDLVGHSRSASKRGMRVNAESVKEYMERTKIPPRKLIEVPQRGSLCFPIFILAACNALFQP